MILSIGLVSTPEDSNFTKVMDILQSQVIYLRIHLLLVIYNPLFNSQYYLLLDI